MRKPSHQQEKRRATWRGQEKQQDKTEENHMPQEAPRQQDRERKKETPKTTTISGSSEIQKIYRVSMTCTRPDVSFALSCKEYLNWQIDKDDSRSQSGWIFLLNGGAITWKSSKQDTVGLTPHVVQSILHLLGFKGSIMDEEFHWNLRDVPNNIIQSSTVALDGTLCLVDQDKLRPIIVDDLSKWETVGFSVQIKDTIAALAMLHSGILTCFVREASGNDLLTGVDYDNSCPVTQLQEVSPPVDTSNLSLHDLDLLFNPMYKEYFTAGNQSVSNSFTLCDNLQQYDTQPTLDVQPTSKPIIIPININAEENNTDQATNAQFEAYEFINPFYKPVQEVHESSS
ncbi:hypothetical protein Tco_0705156 [Tanacetum coccineum]|uniref:Uncharacterized protein n=1 Tax=Tanacetum coccineum TaxID=301880 RepID=A0ABQ4Y3S3_9ASTR